MEAFQVQGAHLTPKKVREFLLDLAESIPQNADIIGSVDTTNPYETLTSFVFDGLGIISIGMFDMPGKGGAL